MCKPQMHICKIGCFYSGAGELWSEFYKIYVNEDEIGYEICNWIILNWIYSKIILL